MAAVVASQSRLLAMPVCMYVLANGSGDVMPARIVHVPEYRSGCAVRWPTQHCEVYDMHVYSRCE